MKRLVLAWAATAVAATAAAVGVLTLLGTGLTGDSGRVLSQAEVHAALNTATQFATDAPGNAAEPTTALTPSTPSTAAPSQTPQPSGASQGKLIRSPGGTVIASCAGDLVTLRSWSPAQNYSVDKVEPGPAREARVEFEQDEGEDVELKITCSSGQPVTQRH
ncbi:hypothetical protein [Nonomuraea sp. NPDC049784]|uniref:hypothetical protein n=1 Tax=Nonomuraea sp. NPDC049784 TaxID=3154361 RepID=UPI0034023DFB